MYKCLPVDDDNVDDLEEIDVVTTGWLTSWLEDNDQHSQIDNIKLLCPHQKLDPCAVTQAKYISARMVSQIRSSHVPQISFLPVIYTFYPVQSLVHLSHELDTNY